MTDLSVDFTLITRLQQGDLAALGQLFDQYRLPVFRISLAITRDPAAAEDILQDTFLRLYQYCGRIDPQRPVLPWLYRVAINLSRTYVSRRSRWRASLDDFIELLVGPVGQRPEPVADHNAELNAMQRALQTLKFDQRVVIILYYINELSVDEIAEVVNSPSGTVKSRLYYGRQNLRKYLVQTNGTPSSLAGWVS